MLANFGYAHMNQKLKTCAEIRNEFVCPCGNMLMGAFAIRNIASCVQPARSITVVHLSSRCIVILCACGCCGMWGAETLSVGVGNFLLLLFGCGHMEYRLKTFAEIRNEFVFPCGKVSFCDQKFCASCV